MSTCQFSFLTGEKFYLAFMWMIVWAFNLAFFLILECTCHQPGTVNGSNVCEPDIHGRCTCKKNVEGPRCLSCKDMFYGLSADNMNGCSGTCPL